MLLLQPLLSSHIGWPKTAVLVVYKENKATINKINQSKIIGKVEGLNAYRLSFEDAESADKARERLRDSQSVQISDNFELGSPGENRVFGGGSPSGFSLKAGNTTGDELIVGLIVIVFPHPTPLITPPSVQHVAQLKAPVITGGAPDISPVSS